MEKGRRQQPPPNSTIKINGVDIRIKTQMKYLGVILDNRLEYDAHVRYAVKKATKVVRALSRLMPNFCGPSESKRKLRQYVQSVIMYGAPIWSSKLMESAGIQRPLRRIQRLIAIRMIAGYRTMSYDMTLLVRMPPWHILADKYRSICYQTKEAKLNDNWTKQVKEEIYSEAETVMRNLWKRIIRRDIQQQGRNNARIKEAICAQLDLWIDRIHGSTNYRLTQLMSSHGCFRHFLYVIFYVSKKKHRASVFTAIFQMPMIRRNTPCLLGRGERTHARDPSMSAQLDGIYSSNPQGRGQVARP